MEVRAIHDTGEDTQLYDLRNYQDLLLGVTFSPRGHTSNTTGQDYIDHYSLNDPWGSIIAFHSPWRDDVANAGQIPTLAKTGIEAAQIYGFVPAIGMVWSHGDGTPELTSQNDPVTNSWLNTDTWHVG